MAKPETNTTPDKRQPRSAAAADPKADGNTRTEQNGESSPRLPHERDESPDGHGNKQHTIIEQAAKDIDSGMVDTDLHNQPGVQKPRPDAKAQPQANTKQD